MSRRNPSFFHSLRFKYGAGLFVLLAVAGYNLWQSHAAHILEYTPAVIALAACVGMHFFMHGGHGHGHGRADKEDGQTGPDRNEKPE